MTTEPTASQILTAHVCYDRPPKPDDQVLVVFEATYHEIEDALPMSVLVNGKRFDIPPSAEITVIGPADAPSRPVAADPASVQGADPTGPHEARTPELGDLVDIRATRVRGENTYCVGFQRFTVPAAAEVTVVARAEPQAAHSGDVEPCDDCESKGRNCLAHRYRAELEHLRDERVRWVGMGRGSREGEVQDLRLLVGAERERADKAEAENSRLRDDILRLQHALNVMAMWEMRAGQATERADKAVTLAADLLAALESTHDGHEDEAGLRARLAELRAGAEEAQSNG